MNIECNQVSKILWCAWVLQLNCCRRCCFILESNRSESRGERGVIIKHLPMGLCVYSCCCWECVSRLDTSLCSSLVPQLCKIGLKIALFGPTLIYYSTNSLLDINKSILAILAMKYKQKCDCVFVDNDTTSQLITKRLVLHPFTTTLQCRSDLSVKCSSTNGLQLDGDFFLFFSATRNNFTLPTLMCNFVLVKIKRIGQRLCIYSEYRHTRIDIDRQTGSSIALPASLATCMQMREGGGDLMWWRLASVCLHVSLVSAIQSNYHYNLHLYNFPKTYFSQSPM